MRPEDQLHLLDPSLLGPPDPGAAAPDPKSLPFAAKLKWILQKIQEGTDKVVSGAPPNLDQPPSPADTFSSTIAPNEHPQGFAQTLAEVSRRLGTGHLAQRQTAQAEQAQSSKQNLEAAQAEELRRKPAVAPGASAQEYLFYAQQEVAAGRKPLSFDEYQARDANRKNPPAPKPGFEELSFEDFLKRKANDPDLQKYPADRNGFRQFQLEQAANVRPPNLSNLSRETQLYKGKPTDVLVDLDPSSKTAGHVFLTGASGLQDVTGQTSHYEKPASTETADANRFQQSYQYHSGELSKLETKADEFAGRAYRLQDNLALGTPQSDAIVIPELVTVIAGGQGTGIRITNAEIQNTAGGRSNWEGIKAWFQRWNTNPKTAGQLTTDQHTQMQQLLQLATNKLDARQKVLNESRAALVDATDEKGHRKVLQDLRQKLTAIESGKTSDSPAGGTTPGETRVTMPDGTVNVYGPDKKLIRTEPRGKPQ